jgi:elongation factor Ts
MAEITAALVKQLRDETGQAMMDCKKALQEADGEMEKAVGILRKKGMAVLEKRGGRETKEGRVVGAVSEDGKSAAMVMVCSETDFTSKSEDFQNAAAQILGALLQADVVPDTVEGILELAGPNGQKVAEVVNTIISKTGEKITIGDFARYDLDGAGILYCYIHFNGKVGTLMQLDTEGDVADTEEVKTLASDLAMHVTASLPQAVTREDMDPAEVAKEKEIAIQQVQGKPEHIVDKIVTGKMNKWYQQYVLLEQPFVKDDKKSVGQLLDEIGKQIGSTLTVKRFKRLQVG